MKTQLNHFAILFFAFLLIPISTQLNAQGFSEVYSGQLDSLYNGSVAWGDYDNDGKLDLLMTGVNSNGFPVTNIYRNTGSGFTKQFTGTIPGVAYGSSAWGDYDSDGKLDFVLTGSDTTALTVSMLYRNTGSGFTQVFAGVFDSVVNSSVAWADYNNDGKLDILLTGANSQGTLVSKIYRNTGSGFTEAYPGSFIGVNRGSVAWGDYDNDGKLDILLAGMDYSYNPLTKLYRNTGSGFTEVYAGTFTGVHSGSVAWGDYDSDGKLDILLTGDSSSFTPVSRIYHNTGSGFTEVYAGSLTPVVNGSAVWGDYDGDGDLDILLTGDDGTFRNNKVYKNTGSGFTVDIASSVLVGYDYSSSAWGDYNNDGNLDFVQIGFVNGFIPISQIITVSGVPANTAPDAPANLTATNTGDLVTFRWNRSTDAQTPTDGLTYNLRIGTSSNGVNTLSPMANATTGFRRVVKLGNTNHDTSWTINIPDTTVATYWSVQAIDNNFAGSPFSSEQQIFVPPAPTYTLTVNYNAEQGSVTKNPDSSSYHNGTEVQLTATANTGYNFVNWTGDITSASNPLSLLMNANKTVSANFAIKQYTLTYTAGANGSISGTTPQTVNHGTNGTQVTAMPATGYHFVNWSDGITTATRQDMSVTANLSVTANFAIDTYTITPADDAHSTIQPAVPTTVNYGASQRFTFSADDGYEIDSVIVDDVNVDSTTGYTFTNVSANHSIRITSARAKTRVTNHTPAKHEIDVFIGTEIQVTFSRPMKQSSFVDTTSFIARGWTSGRHKGTFAFSHGDSVVTFSPTLPFKSGEIVEVEISNKLLDDSNFVIAPTVYTFTTQTQTSPGIFATKVDYATGIEPRSIYASDIDGDGDADIVTANSASFESSVSVLKNNGTGTFATKVYYEVGNKPFSLYVSDIDGDGDEDIVTANNSSNNVSVLKNNGNGTFATKVDYGVGDGPYSVFASDIDGDGTADIVTANYNSNNVSVLKNNGDGIFAMKVDFGVGDGPSSIFSSDIDGDGDEDIVTANNSTNNISVLKNNGAGTFATKVDYIVGQNPQSVFANDIDGDGDVDIMTANKGSHNVSVLKNNGAGTFATKVDYRVGATPKTVYTIDVDGDSDVDIMTANNNSDSVSVLKNDGNGIFASKFDYRTAFSPWSVYASDLDNDGDVDIMTANYGSNTISVLLGKNSFELTTDIGDGDGEIIISPTFEDGMYEEGTQVTLVPLPEEHFVFSSWSGDTANAVRKNDTLIVTMDTSKSITANFEPEKFTITIAPGPNGKIMYDGEIAPSTILIEYGEDFDFTVEPNETYSVKSVSVDYRVVGSDIDNTIPSVDANHIVGATFKLGPQTPSITVTTPNGNEIWKIGETHTIEWTKVNLDSVKVQYTINNGITWKTIDSNITATSLSWVIPDLPSGAAVRSAIRVLSTKNSNVRDISDNYFYIKPVIQPSNTGTTQKLNDMFMYPDGNGWAVGNASTILQTTDAGKTWINHSNDKGVPAGVNLVGIINTYYHYFAIGSLGNNAVVLRFNAIGSIDSFVQDATINDFSPNSICIKPAGSLGNQIPFTVGNNGKVFYEFGGFWQSVTSPTQDNLTSITYRNHITSSGPDNNTTYYITVGKNGTVYQAKVKQSSVSQYSAEWSTLATGVGSNLNDIAFLPHSYIFQNNYNTGWIVGDSGKILKTSDGGSTWVSQSSGTTANLKGISVGVNYGWIVGDDGTVLKLNTLSGKAKWKSGFQQSESWSQVPSGTTKNLNVAGVTGNGSFVTVGDSGTALNSLTQEVILTSPTGGETFIAGQTVPITWSSDGVNYVKIEYSPDSGQTWQSVTNFTSAKNGLYNWKMPNTVLQNVVVAISDLEDSTISDASDSTFRLVQDVAMFRTFRADTMLSKKSVTLKFDKYKNLTSGKGNMKTAVEHVFKRLKATKGATFLGKPQTDKVLKKKLGWIAFGSAADFGKMFTAPHNGTSYPIDSVRLPAPKKSKKLFGALKPTRKAYNNPVWEQGIIFRMNLIASSKGITPKGFGDLVLDTTAVLNGKQLQGMTLSEIGTWMDSVMTWWDTLDYETVDSYTELAEFANLLRGINEAFYDSVTFSNSYIDSMAVIKGDSNISVKKPKNAFAIYLQGTKTASESGGLLKYILGNESKTIAYQPSFSDEEEIPFEYELYQNYPNPFNPSTVIRYQLQDVSTVNLKVYNLLGQEVATLLNNQQMDEGEYEIPFNAAGYASGVYFYRLEATNVEDGTKIYMQVKKMLLMR
ncbi:MAG: VCBS repeat-containing protein [Ignavibacteriae bacterium]|nr:VCBS repeat-containing protein [Ignavibacteriota bacterium]